MGASHLVLSMVCPEYSRQQGCRLIYTFHFVLCHFMSTCFMYQWRQRVQAKDQKSMPNAQQPCMSNNAASCVPQCRKCPQMHPVSPNTSPVPKHIGSGSGAPSAVQQWTLEMLVSGISHDRFCFEIKYKNSPGNLDGCSNHGVYGNPLGQESKGRDNTLSPEDGDGDTYCVLHPSACHDRCRMHSINSNVQAKGVCMCKVGLMLLRVHYCAVCVHPMFCLMVSVQLHAKQEHMKLQTLTSRQHCVMCACTGKQQETESQKCTTSASEQCAIACFDYCTHAADSPK